MDLRAKRERPDRIVGLGEVAELKGMEFGEDRISIGGATTVSDLLHSAGIAEAAPSLAESARLFAGLMVRNTATVAGNIACGSPAADLVPPLLSLDADVTLTSAAATRTVPLDEYFLGYRRDVRRPDELITRISWPRLPGRSVNTFYKLARRKGDAITVTGVAVTIVAAGGICTRARIALGAVAPVVLRAKEAERGLEGRALTPAAIDEAAAAAAAPRAPSTTCGPRPSTGSTRSRRSSGASCRKPGTGLPDEGRRTMSNERTIALRVNGRDERATVPAHRTLLEALREIGHREVKSGCEKGDCGACAVLLDGMAVDSCLTLAWTAEGKEVTTVLGLGDLDALHPVQEAFSEGGAAQCGYCTPGIIIAAKAILDENPDPSEDDIRVGLSGNLCRCTGYTKVFEAVREAAATLRAAESGR